MGVVCFFNESRGFWEPGKSSLYVAAPVGVEEPRPPGQGVALGYAGLCMLARYSG